MAEGQQIEIKQAKGRPMLTWVGKQPLRHVTAFPAQHIESFTAGELDGDSEIWQGWPLLTTKGACFFMAITKRCSLTCWRMVFGEK